MSTGAAGAIGSRGGSLTRRLVVAQVLVMGAMTMTVIAAAALIGPIVFGQHMREAGHGDQPMVLEHAQEAFRAAGLAAMGAGIAIAALGALASGLLLSRRIGGALDALSDGAARVAAGRYAEPVTVPKSGPELVAVAAAFNAMAAQIAETESTRRRLLTDLAHEMRTPVSAIEVMCEALEDGLTQADEATLATLRAQTGRLARLAADVSAVSAAEEGRLELRTQRVQVTSLVGRAIETAAPAFAARGVALTAQTEAEPVTSIVEADPARIGQVLDNLLRNALRHTPSGGRVRVLTRRDGPHALISVVDDGEGIGPQHLPHVFERFYRGDPGRRRDDATGTGVGLSIARAIALAHGGSLTAASDGEGRGATVTLRLPAM